MKSYSYKITIRVQNSPGVLARITIMLRKFNVNIQSIDATPIDTKEFFHDIHLVLESTKNDELISLVFKKLKTLIPVISVTLN